MEAQLDDTFIRLSELRLKVMKIFGELKLSDPA